MADISEMIWNALKDEIAALQSSVTDIAVRYEQAESSENIPASTLANAPLAADGGLANGISFATLRWVNNGRKPGEGAGAGTGVLAVYQSSTDSWIEVNGYAAVQV